MAQINDVLTNVFKLQAFRPPQREVIEHVVAGHSALVLMPTGSGKSLTYQLPAVAQAGLTLVVSPLKALMKDQVDRLRQLGVRASFINSDLSRDAREREQEKLKLHQTQILYVTPERFRKPEFLQALGQVALLVVDEAHCISQWGHDFRPEYANVGKWRKYLGSPPTLALTATATAEVQKDILFSLGLSEEKIFRVPISRPNLAVSVEDLYGFESKVEKCLDILNGSQQGATIVYFSLISSLQKFSSELAKKKIRHECYHGDLNESQRRSAQEKFYAGKSWLMLATPAFGLGIDKANIRNIVHFEMPGSVEAYFQEIGRAGRDGESSRCILLYDQEDVSIQMDFIKWANPDADFIKKIYYLIERNPERVRQEKADFLREQMHFYNKRDYRVETAVNLLNTWGLVEDWSVVHDEAVSGVLSKDQTIRLGIEQQLEQLTGGAAREERMRRQNEKLLKMVQYVSNEGCRMQYIYDYFSEKASEPCGVCDNCLAAKNS